MLCKHKKKKREKKPTNTGFSAASPPGEWSVHGGSNYIKVLHLFMSPPNETHTTHTLTTNQPAHAMFSSAISYSSISVPFTVINSIFQLCRQSSFRILYQFDSVWKYNVWNCSDDFPRHLWRSPAEWGVWPYSHCHCLVETMAATVFTLPSRGWLIFTVV